MNTAVAKSCRRCSECHSENHHWLEECEDPAETDEPFVGYVCKHCDARAEICDACDGAVEPGHVCDFGEDGCIDAEITRDEDNPFDPSGEFSAEVAEDEASQ